MSSVVTFWPSWRFRSSRPQGFWWESFSHQNPCGRIILNIQEGLQVTTYIICRFCGFLLLKSTYNQCFDLEVFSEGPGTCFSGQVDFLFLDLTCCSSHFRADLDLPDLNLIFFWPDLNLPGPGSDFDPDWPGPTWTCFSGQVDFRFWTWTCWSSHFQLTWTYWACFSGQGLWPGPIFRSFRSLK